MRDRAKKEFALASAAVVLDLDGDTIRAARLGLGGIAARPWRATEAERSLTGRKASEANVSRRSRNRTGRSQRARTQLLQDRTGEAHHRARVCHRERRERMSPRQRPSASSAPLLDRVDGRLKVMGAATYPIDVTPSRRRLRRSGGEHRDERANPSTLRWMPPSAHPACWPSSRT